MPSIYALKPRFQQVLQPLTSVLYRVGVTANAVTLSAMFASVLYGVWMLLALDSHVPFLLLPVFMLLRMALNAIDGMLARQFAQQSKLGALLNEVGDVVSDIAIILPFLLWPGVHPILATVVVSLTLLTEFVGVLVQALGGARRYDGPMGKSDRAVVLGGLGLLVGLQVEVGMYFTPIFSIVAVLMVWTVWNRARSALKSLH